MRLNQLNSTIRTPNISFDINISSDYIFCPTPSAGATPRHGEGGPPSGQPNSRPPPRTGGSTPPKTQHNPSSFPPVPFHPSGGWGFECRGQRGGRGAGRAQVGGAHRSEGAAAHGFSPEGTGASAPCRRRWHEETIPSAGGRWDLPNPVARGTSTSEGDGVGQCLCAIWPGPRFSPALPGRGVPTFTALSIVGL